jgi:crossover junction endodeoxyribonuclease RuvC
LLILGIDPGNLRCGFGLLAKSPTGAFCHRAHGTIILDARKIMVERLSDLAEDLSTIIGRYKPIYAVVEDVFFFKNPRSALALGQARGVALGVLALNQIKIHTFSPTAVKAFVTGHGRAQKFQVAHMIAHEREIEIPASPDASDALALALALGRSFK